MRNRVLKNGRRISARHGVVLKAARQYLCASTAARRRHAACLERYIEFSPDQWGFNTLANLYWEQKDTAKWKETLEQSLEQEDFALSHASTRVETGPLPYGPQRVGSKLVAYADDAAATGADMGHDVCGLNATKLGSPEQWDVSEQLMRATAALAMPTSKWTGTSLVPPHSGAATRMPPRRLGMQRVRALTKSINANDLDHIGAFHILADDPKAAHTAFKAAFDKQTGAYSGIHLALSGRRAG